MTSSSSADPSSEPARSPAAQCFREFWPIYLAAHSKAATRRIHVAGTVLGTLLVAASAFGGPLLALAGVAVAYGLAWTAHLCVEGNRPATFGHPLWSLWGDLRMTLLFITGRLDDALRRHHIGDV
jgi:hypothetical protein